MAISSLSIDPAVSVLLSGSVASLVIAAIVWVLLFRPALGLMFFFVLFSFAWRLCSDLYIDVYGPISSEQLERNIGSGISAVPLALAQSVVIVALLWSFRQPRLQALFARDDSGLGSCASGGRFQLSDVTFWLASMFVAALWLELLAGPIPLFTGMERFDYARQYGGPLHRLLLQWGPMLAFQLGVFMVAPAFRGRSLDWRFPGLFACLILYLFLVGHRFSSFFSYASFFILPLGAAILGRREALFSSTLLRRILIVLVIFCGLIVAALAHSYLVVRGFHGAQLHTKLSQRILVQQGEMWWMTYERVFLHNDWGGSLAASKLFLDPYDPNRNSTMQFLMELALPLDRAHFIIGSGSAYTGGWPEVLFELGGPTGGFVLVVISAFLFAEFMFLLMRCIVEERFATCFFLTPVLYALMVNLVSGMVNSFVQLAFVLKLAMALLTYVAEERWRSGMLSSIAQTPSDAPAIEPKG